MTNRKFQAPQPESFFVTIIRNDGTIVICKTEEEYLAFLKEESEW